MTKLPNCTLKTEMLFYCMRDFLDTFKYKWVGYLRNLIVIVLLGSIAYGIYFVYTPYQPNGFTLASIKSENTDLQIIETENYISIIPNSNGSTKPASAYIFYQGGRVEPESYLRHFAYITSKQKVASFILKSSFNFAITNVNLAQKVLDDNPTLQNVFVGGHSLGGVAASTFVSANLTNTKVKGLFLWAAYPSDSKLQMNSSLQVISIYGSKDAFVTEEKIQESKTNLPSKTTFIKIQGMNHSEFGDYGLQSGDNIPDISTAKAIEEIEKSMKFNSSAS